MPCEGALALAGDTGTQQPRHCSNEGGVRTRLSTAAGGGAGESTLARVGVPVYRQSGTIRKVSTEHSDKCGINIGAASVAQWSFINADASAP